MQTVRTTLPEFIIIGFETITAPEYRLVQLLLICDLIMQIPKTLLEFLTTCHDATLWGANMRGNLAFSWTFMIIIGRFFFRYFLYTTRDTNLTFLILPVEQQFSIRIFSQIQTFLTVIVGIKIIPCVSRSTQ